MPLRDPQQTAEAFIQSQDSHDGEGRVVRSYKFAFEPTDPRRLTVHESFVDTRTLIKVDEKEVSFGLWIRGLVEWGGEDVTTADIFELEKRIGVTLLEGMSNG